MEIYIFEYLRSHDVLCGIEFMPCAIERVSNWQGLDMRISHNVLVPPQQREAINW